MEIDRRNLLTAFATSTAAAMLPTLPATAALSGGVYFLDGPIYSNLPPLPDGYRSAILDALWHFDPNHGGPWLIRHVPSGLTCRLSPQDHDDLALQAVSIESPLAEGAMTLIGRAARVTAAHAYFVLGCRPWHEGAVFFHYPQVHPRYPYALPLTEDALPLSPDSSSGPPRGNRTVLPSDLTSFFPSDA
jgi:hypothetical protein